MSPRICSMCDSREVPRVSYLNSRVIGTAAVRVVATAEIRLLLERCGAAKVDILGLMNVTEALRWVDEVAIFVCATAESTRLRPVGKEVKRVIDDESTEGLKVRVAVDGTVAGVRLLGLRVLACLLLVGISLSRAGALARVGPSNFGSGHPDKGNGAYSPQICGMYSQIGAVYERDADI